ncbi:hypothetical protein ACFWH7_04490 [Cellulosimicrobium cellulans]|uniref:hypothetical protein n=1 Tax=Cellulosimicrobium cellulans TaxID=1710 RepID=UPI00364E8284
MDEDAREHDDEPVALETRGVGAEMLTQGALALAFGAAPSHALLTAIAPFAARALDASARELFGVRLRRVGSMLAAATEAAGSEETLADAIAASEETQELAFDTAERAAQSRVPEAVIAMGRALANGLLADGTKLEESRMVIEALASLTPPHVRVLQVMADGPGRQTELNIAAYLDDGWRDALPRLLAGLEREGLIRERPREDPTFADVKSGQNQLWSMTSMGRRSWEVLREVGSES